MANNKVTIYIHNQRYRFLAEENEDYLQQCADIVNKEMDNAMDGNTLSITDGAVLAAMNVADKYCKERLVSDNLRAQLKQALDENARLAKEMSEMKREARKATKEKAKTESLPWRRRRGRWRRGWGSTRSWSRTWAWRSSCGRPARMCRCTPPPR